MSDAWHVLSVPHAERTMKALYLEPTQTLPFHASAPGWF